MDGSSPGVTPSLPPPYMESVSMSPGQTTGPVLPMFIQLNARLVEEDDQWKEVSRWVKFQENVEDGGKRWSKPHVPSCSFNVFAGLKHKLDTCPVILSASGTSIHTIVDEVMNTPEAANLDDRQKAQIKHLFTQGVKHKMRMNLVRQMSKTSTSRHPSVSSRQDSGIDKNEDVFEEAIEDDNDVHGKSAPTTPETERKVSLATQPKVRHYSAATQEFKSPNRKISLKDETMKFREYNLFSKKVPKNAEAVNIQVATCKFLTEPFLSFVRLNDPVILEDFCEISKPTRFLVLVLGPEGSSAQLLDQGRAIGTLLTDQLFCQLTAYKAQTKAALISGLETYMNELTVLPPSSWDPSIRLDPPKTTQSLQSRLMNRAANRERRKSVKGKEEGPDNNDDDDEEDDLFLKNNKDEKDHGDDDSLQFTGQLFGGLIADVKRKLPWFASDFKDALHIQTLASIIYIYLATVTKAITFGGFLGDITDGLQGVLESFMGHLLAGGIFCLFGGQPLTVLGCTGPVLIFEKILVEFCKTYEIFYLTMRLWIGLWSALFCIIIVAVDGSAIVRYFTRFTEEAFAALVGLIFIVESLKKIYKMNKTYKVHKYFDLEHLTQEEPCRCDISLPGKSIFETWENATAKDKKIFNSYNKTMEGTIFGTEDVGWANLTRSECFALGGNASDNCHYSPDIFFLSVFLFFGTFFLCTFLKKFKYTPFFPTKMRSLITDYAVILTIIVFVLVDGSFGLDTPKLIVPTVFKPTRSDLRGWTIPLTDEKSGWYIYLLASIPALLLTILLFMDQQITSVIVNRKEHKLKKGGGYHLDMLIVGVMMGVCSLLGLPWCVAATVLCLGHVDSLKMDTESSAPGETPQFLGVREQRVTGICVFLLTGLSVKLAPILKYIPMPVLYGVLMYMGVNTLNGMQFIDRIGLMLMPGKHQPDYIYLRHVPLKKVHLFTCIQAGCLAALWLIKSTPASLVFPLMVLALVGFRKVMDFFPNVFSQTELFWLDNLMPESNKKGKKEKKNKKNKEKGTKEELAGLTNGDTKLTDC